MQRNKHELWVEKYRPRTVDEYIFHDPQQRASIMRMIADKSIPHLLLSGVQGSGKTTLARILISVMGVDSTDVLIINASDERGIDTFRDKIRNFATTMPVGTFKIVLLEEASALTPDAQNALKRFMEEYADTARFILTCNHENKVIPPIKSRCQHFHFKASDKNDIAEYLITILAHEQVIFELGLLDKYIAYGYPDVRKIVNTLQQNSIDGKLQMPRFEGTDGDYKFKLIDLIERDKWLDARKLVCASVTSEEWEDVYRFLYDNISRAPTFQQKDKWEEAIIVIAEHLYKNSIVADPEINAAAMFIRLGQLQQ
ncbi:MAG: AAA family ATPase [Candidatus Thorarchaeota archaeon]|nr:MAG: AAA family ATPase [Candidatus Thorarchaeota archaeon]